MWRSVVQPSAWSRATFKIRSGCSKPWQGLKISKGGDWTAPLGPCLGDALDPLRWFFSIFPNSISLVAACDCCLLFFCCASLRKVCVCLLQWIKIVEDCNYIPSWPSHLQAKQTSCPSLSLYIRYSGPLTVLAALLWSLSRLTVAVLQAPNSSCGAVCSALCLTWRMGYFWPRCVCLCWMSWGSC